MNILVVDDEKEIADIIAAYLKNEGYNVFKANDGTTALEIVEKEHVDIAILDVMLPDINGFDVLKRIRSEHTFPVIMLTAKNEYSDRINGLTLGADDYIPKPFNPLELVARVKANLRRYKLYNQPMDENTLMYQGLELNKETGICKYGETKINLTRTEFEILYLLCESKGDTVSPEEIREKIWGEASDEKNNVVMVHIRHLREKMTEAIGKEDFIKTAWGKGYKING